MMALELVVPPGHFLSDVLRPLTEAELGPADRLQHLAGAGEYLAGREEGDEPGGEALERDVTARQIVLVTAVGVPSRIRVVLEGEDGSTEILLPKQAAGAEEEVRDDALAGLVVGHQIADLGRPRGSRTLGEARCRDRGALRSRGRHSRSAQRAPSARKHNA